MGCKIKFVDGEELDISQAKDYEKGDDFVGIQDEEGEELYIVSISQVKYLKWD